MAEERFRLGVDVGGTFTDLVILSEQTGKIRTLKVPSTPVDPSQAVLDGVVRAREELGVDLGTISQFSHGTTVASNTILEGLGARTALCVTEGFRDILEIQRHKRFSLFDLNYRKVPPLVPRRLVVEVPERIGVGGEVVRPLDEAALVRSLEALAAEDIEALAVCLLFSFANDAHERRVGEIARAILPNCFVTLSKDIFPQYREYERASTTVVNAYLGPRVSRYLERMTAETTSAGIRAPLHLMQSNGGIIAAAQAQRIPCRIIESGPAAGVIAAAHFGALVGRDRLIAFDMGGTTAKAGLVENGQVRQAAGQEVGAGINQSRLLQGGGYYIGAASVDLAEVGAGGGSIAWLDAGSIIKVGPRSAGADPGPVCYGRGGEEVTVTDANLILGRIPQDYLLGGEMPVSLDRARAAVRKRLAEPLGLSVEEACAAVIEVANANMLKMLRVVSVEQGHDPREFTVVAFGGGGPVHAAELAEELEIGEIFVPPSPGLLSAQGLLAADIRYDFRQTYVQPLHGAGIADAEAAFAVLEQQGWDALRAYGLAEESVALSRVADMRYRRQGYEISVPIPAGPLSAAAADEIEEAFHQAHERLYGHRHTGADIQFVNLAVTATGRTRPLEHQPLPRGDGAAAVAKSATRPVLFPRTGFIACPIYARARLCSDDSFEGPAIVEAPDSTTVVPPGWSVRCDAIGNLFLTRRSEP